MLFITVFLMGFSIVGNPLQAMVAKKVEAPVASAGFLGVFCSGPDYLGPTLGQSDWKDPLGYYPHQEKGGRKLTLVEAYGQGTRWANYQGEGGKGDAMVMDVGTERGKMYEKFKSKVDDKTLTEPRNISNCVFGVMLNSTANVGLTVASGITTFARSAAVVVFDSSFICSDPTNNSGHCLNIVSVVGGNSNAQGSREGIIGTLTTSVYLPLLMIVAAIAGFWILWQGMVKGRIREALFGFVWVFLSVILGIGFLQYPLLIAKAPMAANNTIATCVIGMFNGMDCTQDSGNGGAPLKDSNPTGTEKSQTLKNICSSGISNGSMDTQMSMAVSSISCSIWKAFVAEPFSQGSFGRSFESMDVTDPNTSKVIKDAGLDPKDFCVNLRSSEPLANSEGEFTPTLTLDGKEGQVCNVAAYQMALGTNAVNKANDDAPHPTDKKNQKDYVNWYKVILFAAHDKAMWSNWNSGVTQGLYKNSIGFIAAFTALLGSILIIVVSFYALIYYLSSVILIAFIPVFLLFGVHPGRGRKILLGFFEKIASNIMKYLASAIFLVVSIAFYGGILGSITSMGATLIFVAVITAALFMNRQQIIDLIGRVNMGGEQLAHKAFSQTWAGRNGKRVVKKGEKVTRSAVGGAIGAVAATAGSDDPNYSIRKTLAHGARQGTKRELRKGTTILAGALREADKASADNKRDLLDKGRQAKQNAQNLSTALQSTNFQALNAREEMLERKSLTESSEKDYTEMVDTANAVQGHRNEVIQKFAASNPDFAAMEAIAARLQNLKLQHTVAMVSGDAAEAARLNGEIQGLEGDYATRASAVDPAAFAAWRSNFNSALEHRLQNNDVNYDPNMVGYDDQFYREFEDTIRRYTDDRRGYTEANARFNELVESRNGVLDRYAQELSRGNNITQAYTDLRDGEMFTKKEQHQVIQDASKDVAQVNHHIKDYGGHVDKAGVAAFSGARLDDSPLLTPPPFNDGPDGGGPNDPPNDPSVGGGGTGGLDSGPDKPNNAPNNDPDSGPDRPNNGPLPVPNSGNGGPKGTPDSGPQGGADDRRNPDGNPFVGGVPNDGSPFGAESKGSNNDFSGDSTTGPSDDFESGSSTGGSTPEPTSATGPQVAASPVVGAPKPESFAMDPQADAAKSTTSSTQPLPDDHRGPSPKNPLEGAGSSMPDSSPLESTPEPDRAEPSRPTAPAPSSDTPVPQASPADTPAVPIPQQDSTPAASQPPATPPVQEAPSNVDLSGWGSTEPAPDRSVSSAPQQEEPTPVPQQDPAPVATPQREAVPTPVKERPTVTPTVQPSQSDSTGSREEAMPAPKNRTEPQTPVREEVTPAPQSESKPEPPRSTAPEPQAPVKPEPLHQTPTRPESPHVAPTPRAEARPGAPKPDGKPQEREKPAKTAGPTVSQPSFTASPTRGVQTEAGGRGANPVSGAHPTIPPPPTIPTNPSRDNLPPMDRR